MALVQSRSLAISMTDKPECGTFEAAAALMEWALNLLQSIHASAITILGHLANVHDMVMQNSEINETSAPQIHVD